MATRRGDLRVLRGTTIHGPMTRDQLAGLVAAGRVAGTDLVSAAEGPWSPVAAYLGGGDRSEAGDGRVEGGGTTPTPSPSPWHYARGGSQFGPISGEQLKELAASGGLSPADLIWREGLPDWRPAGTLRGLFKPAVTRAAGPPPLPVARAAGPVAPATPTGPATVGGVEGACPGEPPGWGTPRRGRAVIPGCGTPRGHAAASIVPLAPALGGIAVQRLGIAASAGLGMLATFLPWATLPIAGTVTGAAGDGWITLALFTPAIVLALRGDRASKVVGKARLGATIPAAVASLVAVHKLVSLSSILAGPVGSNSLVGAFAGSVQAGVGLYVLALSGAAVNLAAWMPSWADGRAPDPGVGGPESGGARGPGLLDGARDLATRVAGAASNLASIARAALLANPPPGKQRPASPVDVAGIAPETMASPGARPRRVVLAGGGIILLLVLAGGLAGRLPGVAGITGGARLAKREFIARIDALGNPCRRSDLLKVTGEPVRTQTLDGVEGGVFWYFPCRDGMVQVELLNPKAGIGEHNDESLAYISGINDY